MLEAIPCSKPARIEAVPLSQSLVVASASLCVGMRILWSRVRPSVFCLVGRRSFIFILLNRQHGLFNRSAHSAEPRSVIQYPLLNINVKYIKVWPGRVRNMPLHPL